MSLTVNGHAFANARLIEPGTSWGELRQSLHQSKPRVARNSITAHTLTIGFILKGPNCASERELLQGLMQQGQVVVIRSTTQKFWGQSSSVIATCLSLSMTEETPTYWSGVAEVEYRGAVENTGLVLDVSTVQDFNDYDLAGITTIGIPAGTSRVVDPGDGTNFAVTTRGTDSIVTNYDALDTGVYVENERKQTSIEFLYDAIQGHTNAVKVLDGTDEITNSDHVFTDEWTIQNAQIKVVSDSVAGVFELRETNDTLLERFTVDNINVSLVQVLNISSEHVALLIDYTLVLELFRARDLVVHVLSGTLKYVDAAGSAQESGPGDNSLQIPGTSVYVSSNGFFKTTGSKEILLQDGGDTNPSALTTSPRFQIFKPSGDLATRKLEVLKRQA